MSINKFALSLALAGILGATSAVAEESGFFAGVSVGLHSMKNDFSANNSLYSADVSSTGIKYGILGGYHQKLGDSFGARYYGALDIGNLTTNVNANADALYTFIKDEKNEISGFAGFWAGYVSYSGGASGFDLGLNIGARWAQAQHALELFGKFGFLSNEEEQKSFYSTWTDKYSQPYQIGVRYTYSF